MLWLQIHSCRWQGGTLRAYTGVCTVSLWPSSQRLGCTSLMQGMITAGNVLMHRKHCSAEAKIKSRRVFTDLLDERHWIRSVCIVAGCRRWWWTWSIGIGTRDKAVRTEKGFLVPQSVLVFHWFHPGRKWFPEPVAGFQNHSQRKDDHWYRERVTSLYFKLSDLQQCNRSLMGGFELKEAQPNGFGSRASLTNQGDHYWRCWAHSDFYACIIYFVLAELAICSKQN